MVAALSDEQIELARKRVELKMRARQFKASHQREFPWDWYEWQLELQEATQTHSDVWLLAANQIGKTEVGGYTAAVMITGDYPEDWKGHRFSVQNLRVWLMGVDSKQLREVLQGQIFGTLQKDGTFTGGWIHPDEVVDVIRSRTTSDLAEEVMVKTKQGGIARVALRTYSQLQTGSDTLPVAGEVVDLIYCDEQPPDKAQGQLTVRTTNGDGGRGGRRITTLTPELGLTDELERRMNNPGTGQIVMGPIGWDRAPHLTPEKQERLLAAIPPHEREMRTKGVPFFGSGLVFPVSEDRFVCDPFRPEDRPWGRVLRAIDFGADHPTAVSWLFYDPDVDTVYLTRTYRESLKWADGVSPVATHTLAANSQWKHSPMVYPHDGDNETAAGEALARQYMDAGIPDMLAFSNPTPDDKRNIRVEPGIQTMLDAMQAGKFKVFNTCTDFLEERRAYHRKDGKIVKVRDDSISATRYGYMMVKEYGVPVKGFRAGSLPTHYKGSA